MKLIIWLWNPWDKYKQTRHNVWFMFTNYLKEKFDFSDFFIETKFKAEVSNGIIKWEKVILIKPQTFMNLSWESVRKVVDFYKIDKKDLVVIYDDLSMDFWKIRFREKWSAWWHNWVKSIITNFWDEFNRIKIWIWFNSNYEVSDWVLSKFRQEEIDELNDRVFGDVYNLYQMKDDEIKQLSENALKKDKSLFTNI